MSARLALATLCQAHIVAPAITETLSHATTPSLLEKCAGTINKCDCFPPFFLLGKNGDYQMG